MRTNLKALVLLPWLLVATSLPVRAQSVTVDWTKAYQTIDGFGGAVAEADSAAHLTPAQAELFFSTTNGVGLSLFRTLVPFDGSCSNVNSQCAGQVSDMQLALSYGARIWSAPWSPPASMKSNGNFVCTNNAGLRSDSYGAYATYLSNYISSLSTLYNIPLYALSIQNEPDYCPSTYAGAIWSATAFRDFITNNLGPTLAANGQSGVQVMMPESSHWSSFSSLANTCMVDSACAQYVGITAWHDYDNASSITNPYSSSGSSFWETEVSGIAGGVGPSLCRGCWDPSMADALLWAGIIDKRMTVSNANAWNYWELIGDQGDNEGLVYNDVVSKRLYMMGNYAKFVRPGWVRIGATHAPAYGVTVSAYKDPVGGGFAIVVTNKNSSAATVHFSLSGFSPSSVIPWVTSGDLNLAQGSPIQVASGSFSATVPVSSVTTFVGSSVPAPLAISTQSLPAGVVGGAYSAQVSATGGTPPYTWTSLGLADGLSLSATTGRITGTPTTSGTYSATITVTDSATPASASNSVVFEVSIAPPPPIAFKTTSLPGGTVGTAYSASIVVTGGVPPYTVTASTLPPGLSVSASGAITGTPHMAGIYSPTFTANDSASDPSATATFGVTIAPAPPIAFKTTSLPGGTVGTAYSASIVVTGGVPPYTVTASNLPPGLSVSASGAITGTPNMTGTYSPTFTANDSALDSPATASFTILVSPMATGTSLNFWTPSIVPGNTAGNDQTSVEIGIKFSASVSGHVLGARIYCATNSSGTHTVHLWNTSGKSLATVTMPGCRGWTTVNFASPVAVVARTTYVLSYHTTEYPWNSGFFSTALTVGNSTASLTAPKNAGVYAYGTRPAYPSNSWNGTNYWVDVLFTAP